MYTLSVTLVSQERAKQRLRERRLIEDIRSERETLMAGLRRREEVSGCIL
jgi:hypothetical protein